MEEKEKRFMEFIEKGEVMQVKIRTGTQVGDVLSGIAVAIEAIMDEKDVSQLEIFKIISEIIDEFEKNKKKIRKENDDGSKQ